jgi:hypothetical protein
MASKHGHPQWVTRLSDNEIVRLAFSVAAHALEEEHGKAVKRGQKTFLSD